MHKLGSWVGGQVGSHACWRTKSWGLCMCWGPGNVGNVSGQHSTLPENWAQVSMWSLVRGLRIDQGRGMGYDGRETTEGEYCRWSMTSWPTSTKMPLYLQVNREPETEQFQGDSSNAQI